MSEPAGGFDLTLEQVDAYEFKVKFDKEAFAELKVDEPPPLGKDAGPNPTRLLAAAVANCLSASLVFCMSKQRAPIAGVKSRAHVALVRNDQKRLRIGHVDVTITLPPGVDAEKLQVCRGMFEEFCVVTQSVREGLKVNVALENA